MIMPFPFLHCFVATLCSKRGDAMSPWLSAEAGAEADTLRLIAALARCMDAGKPTASNAAAAAAVASAQPSPAAGAAEAARPGDGGADAASGGEGSAKAAGGADASRWPAAQLCAAALAALATVFEDKSGKPSFVLSASRTSALCEIAGRLVAAILRPGAVVTAESMRPGSLDILAGAMSAAPSWVARRTVDGCSFVGERSACHHFQIAEVDTCRR